jgi:hypothetical protein
MFCQRYTYSSHYGASQVPQHLDGTVVDTLAPSFLEAAEGVPARGLELPAA